MGGEDSNVVMQHSSRSSLPDAVAAAPVTSAEALARLKGKFAIKDFHLTLPAGPGLGSTLDEDRVRRTRVNVPTFA